MEKQRATEILKERDAVSIDNGLHSLGWYLSWKPREDDALLDGSFTVEELEAIVWWMKHYG